MTVFLDMIPFCQYYVPVFGKIAASTSE